MAKQSPILGGHLSIAGGFHYALYAAKELSCTAVQIFTHSNRQWAFNLPSEQEALNFTTAQEKLCIKTVIAHATYLINPASPNKESRCRAIDMLKMELRACALLKIPYLVVHPGSRLEAPLEDSLRYCADSINYALEKNENIKILIENMAGQGSVVGSKLEELQQIHDAIEQKDRVGYCFDTCHGFAAGYDFTTKETYATFWNFFDTLLGIEKLHVIHVNDSLKSLGSHIDRHADIGNGKIPLEAFRLIMNDEKFSAIAKIIETPKGIGLEKEHKNLSVLRSLIK